MTATFIYPEDIGAYSAYSDQWKNFIAKFGYDGTGPIWECVLLSKITTN